jgi:signal transduction histidine kinase
MPERRIRRSLIERLSLGYDFGQDREAFSLVFVNYFLIFLFALVVLTLYLNREDPVPITYRYHGIILLGLLELWFLHKRWINLARVLILTLLPFLLLILPPLGGIHSDEFFFWFPYVPIGMSLIPHFILHPFRHRPVLILSLVFYLLMTLFADNYLILLSDGSEGIIRFVEENRFYYKLIPVFLFFFVNVALGLLLSQNYRYAEIMKLQQNELVQSEKMASLGIFTAGLAHEINNPLNFISGSLNALNTLQAQLIKNAGDASSGQEELLQQIDAVVEKSFEGVNRATDIITKLELFSHPEKESGRRSHSLETLVLSSLKRMESRLPYFGTLITEIPPDLEVICDEQLIRLVFTHILRNAIDALETKTDKKTREFIKIRGSKERAAGQSFARVLFFNSGPPIPEIHLKHIFDPFFSSRDPGEGQGLGMSLSYMIIKEHGGRIEVDNHADGVRFDIWLPVGGN